MNLVEAEVHRTGRRRRCRSSRRRGRRTAGCRCRSLFTLSVLIGTVVAIYMVFPARHNVLLDRRRSPHHASRPAWDLAGADARPSCAPG